MPEPECQKMLRSKPLEAKFKNKQQLTFHGSPILEIRTCNERFVFLPTEGVRQSVSRETAKREKEMSFHLPTFYNEQRQKYSELRAS
jgi:hypothetical protein